MRGPLRVAFAVSVVTITLILGATHTSASGALNRWSGLSALGFTQGFVRSMCPEQPPCQDDGFSVGGSTFVSCIADPGNNSSCFGDVSNIVGWGMFGIAGHFPGPPPADVPIGASLDVDGERVSATSFRVHGTAVLVGEPQVQHVGAFRYAGDPAVFDGIEAQTVNDLVNLGLIQAGDVLLDEVAPSPDFSFDFVPFEYFVDVTGIPDEEIVIFAGGNGPSPTKFVPAVTPWGAASLVALLLAAAAWRLRSRQAG